MEQNITRKKAIKQLWKYLEDAFAISDETLFMAIRSLEAWDSIIKEIKEGCCFCGTNSKEHQEQILNLIEKYIREIENG